MWIFRLADEPGGYGPRRTVTGTRWSGKPELALANLAEFLAPIDKHAPERIPEALE
jgi:hypothetical protein